MRNITEIHFSDNGKFSGKPDLPVEIFFLVSDSCPMSGEILTVRTTRVVPWRAVHRKGRVEVNVCSQSSFPGRTPRSQIEASYQKDRDPIITVPIAGGISRAR